MNFEEMKNNKESLLKIVKNKGEALFENLDKEQLIESYVNNIDKVYEYKHLIRDLRNLNAEHLAELIEVVLALDDYAFLWINKKKNGRETYSFIMDMLHKIFELWKTDEVKSTKLGLHYHLRIMQFFEELEIDSGK